jgi:hypothetical protein
MNPDLARILICQSVKTLRLARDWTNHLEALIERAKLGDLMALEEMAHTYLPGYTSTSSHQDEAPSCPACFLAQEPGREV